MTEMETIMRGAKLLRLHGGTGARRSISASGLPSHFSIE
jgi:hypothetical protein